MDHPKEVSVLDERWRVHDRAGFIVKGGCLKLRVEPLQDLIVGIVSQVLTARNDPTAPCGERQAVVSSTSDWSWAQASRPKAVPGATAKRGAVLDTLRRRSSSEDGWFARSAIWARPTRAATSG